MTKDTTQQCTKYSSRDCAGFVRLQVEGHERSAFLSHAESCQCCRSNLVKETLAWRNQQDEIENRQLYAQSLSIMDQLDQSVFSIVVKAAKGVFEFIRSTGELLVVQPVLAGARSHANVDTVSSGIVRITKEIDYSRLSVEVAISPLDPDMLLVQVSLLDRQQEEFVKGATVSCIGETFSHSGVTDETGQVTFRIPATGFFELTLSQGERVFGIVTVTGL